MKYGVIAEFKNEGPLLMECTPMTESEASDRASKLMLDSRVIRVAVVSLQYRWGNETLAPSDQDS